MTTFQKTIESIQEPKQCYEERQRLIKEIEQLTSRRLLVYVADFKKLNNTINIEDKTGFSDLIEGITEKEVDILINSVGGFAEVTEALVNMLRSRFDNIRFSIPNMAKSAATLFCFSGNKLMMDHRSELGPIDPQVEYISSDGWKREAAEDILDGFEEAKDALKSEGPEATPAYVPLLNKYTIGLLRGCKNAKNLSKNLSENWLRKYMFADDSESTKPKEITDYFSARSETLSHNRYIGIDKCIELGVEVVDLREDKHTDIAQRLWKLWCLCELHFERSSVYKFYENSIGCHLSKQTAQIQIGQIQKPDTQKKT